MFEVGVGVKKSFRREFYAACGGDFASPQLAVSALHVPYIRGAFTWTRNTHIILFGSYRTVYWALR